jgi:2,4-dienoyl-CoA reductase-like NADH-dependent reductase (Old Yellow Enzyme family)
MRVLSPSAVGHLVLANRVVFSATANNLGRNNHISDAQIEFYRERAEGGVGALVTEAFSVHPSSVPSAFYPMACDPGLAAGLARIAAAAHTTGTPLIGQLHHAGGKGYVASQASCAWSITDQRDPVSGCTPHRANEDELWDLVEAFRLTADNLYRAGFDGVELHAAHDFLLAQSLSPRRNDRDDAFGGDAHRRQRLILEIIRAIRRDHPDDFVIGLRVSGDEFAPGGLDAPATREVVGDLVAQESPDYLAVSQGSFGPNFDRHLPDMRFPDAPFVYLAQNLRRQLSPGVPVMAVGKIRDLDIAERLLDEGVADLIGLCRPLLADSHLVERTAVGATVRPCIHCNQCWHELQMGRPVRCLYGPQQPLASVPHSAHADVSDAAGLPRRTVRVVGAGPAGLEVARLVARAGHRVVVHEQSDQAGGHLQRESMVPGRQEVGRAVDWFVADALDAGAELQLSSAIGSADVAAWPSTDILVQATGAVFDWARGVSPAGPSSMSLEEVIADPSLVGRRVVIIDELDDEPVYALAELLIDLGHQVTLVSAGDVIGRDLSLVSRMGAMRRMRSAGVALHPSSVAVSDPDGVAVTPTYGGMDPVVIEADTVVVCGRYRSSVEEAPLRPDAYLVGDALSRRSLLATLDDGRRVAGLIIGGQ